MKMYPFSWRKHAHDLQFYSDWLFNEMYDMMEGGTKPYNESLYDEMERRRDKITELQCAAYPDSRGVTMFTGEQIGFAKECVIWANEERSERRVARMNKGA